MIGLVFGQEAAQSAIMNQVRNLVGPQSADAIKEMIARADQPSTGVVSTIIATVTLLVGAAGFFNQLKDALNTVWGIEPKAGRGIWGFLKDNFLSFATLIGTGFLLLVSLIISTALSAFGKWFGGLLPLPEFALQGMNVLVSLVVITGLFALIFKALPDARIAWSDVWVGAALTVEALEKVEPLAGGGVPRGHVAGEPDLVGLGLAREPGRQDGDARAAAEVPHHVEDAGGRGHAGDGDRRQQRALGDVEDGDRVGAERADVCLRGAAPAGRLRGRATEAALARLLAVAEVAVVARRVLGARLQRGGGGRRGRGGR